MRLTSCQPAGVATMNPRSRSCGVPVEGQYTSLRTPWQSVTHTREEPSPVLTTSLALEVQVGAMPGEPGAVLLVGMGAEGLEKYGFGARGLARTIGHVFG